ncbi:2-oxoglutarate-dependent dioxygenase 11-like [Zingiber officinale]|uniref:2-oxoglutarate-dependent dioxygenase 11-like n=1 Tax=Zingiber officinale TaxID=94328 RepID=UPI001C4C72B9|nr:2-oxoglutarate-dependent dioxygenase 11-like [Zingiber officinale]
MAEEVSYLDVATSIAVDNVQALAAVVTDVPPRYLRPEVAADPVAPPNQTSLPIVDLRMLIDASSHREEAAKLHDALSQWGFFQLINHQVPDDLIEQLKSDMADYFNLPLEEKKEFAQLPDGLQGYGQAFVVSEDQKLDWADMHFVVTRPVHQRNMRFWPTRPPSFRGTLERYSVEAKRVASILLAVMAESLEVAEEELMEAFEGMPQGIRMNYYPPCRESGKVVGLSPHTDGVSSLTLLLQANDVNGLQVKHEGLWVPVEPLPGAFIVNAGDILEILTNGKYKSGEHRAMINPNKERLSIATFLFAKDDGQIGPLPGIMKGGKENFITWSYKEYQKSFYTSKLDGPSILEKMKIN